MQRRLSDESCIQAYMTKSRGAWIIAVVVLLAGGVTWWLMRPPGPVREAAGKLMEAKAIAREVGLLQDASSPVPVANNAAPIYREWIEDWEKVPVAKRENLWKTLDKFFEEPNENRDALVQALKGIPDQTPWIDRAVALPVCDFEYKMDDGEQLWTPELTYLNRFAKLELALADYALIQKDDKSAMKHVRRAILMAKHLGQSAIAYPTMEMRKSEYEAWEILIRLLNGHELDASRRTWIRGMIAEWMPRTDIAQVFRTAAKLDYATATNLRKNGPRNVKLTEAPTTDPYLEAYESTTLQYWTTALKILDQESKNPYKLTSRLTTLVRTSENSDDPSTIIQRTSNNRLSFMWLRLRSMDSYIQLLLAALDVFDFREQKGYYPGKMTLTRPDIMGRSVIQYRRKADGFIVYSLGFDGTDQNGEAGIGRDGVNGDMVLRYSPLPDRNEVAGFRRVIGVPKMMGFTR